MRRAKYAALHADTIGRVDAPEQAALVIGDDFEDRRRALPPSRAGMQQQMSFTPLARHRGELLPPGWEHAAPAWGEPDDADGVAAVRLRQADVNAVSELLLARLRRKARDLAAGTPAGGRPQAIEVDAQRHARLQAAAARQGRRCEDLVAEAIDSYLDADDDHTYRS